MLNGLQCVIFLVIHCGLSLGVHWELIVQAAIVSILLTERIIIFMYLIEMQIKCVFFMNRRYVKIYVLDDLNSFEYVEN
jgi:hypothetical protein